MRGTPINLSPIKRSVARCHEVMNVWRYEEWAGNLRMLWATGTVPERVQSRVHTTEPTGPVPEPFHCDHIARWSARSGTTGRSGTGVNTGARLRSGTVPVPKLWCEHGLSCTITFLRKWIYLLVEICVHWLYIVLDTNVWFCLYFQISNLDSPFPSCLLNCLNWSIVIISVFSAILYQLCWSCAFGQCFVKKNVTVFCNCNSFGETAQHKCQLLLIYACSTN